MLSNIFESILTEGTFTSAQFAVVTLTSLVCGFIIAAGYSVRNKCSRSFAITLIMLPAIVELVIILVNGNIGAGVAVLTGIGAGLGIGKATGSAVDAIARQPEAEGKISKALLLGCALAEATAIYGFVLGILCIFFLK